ncbi:MAG: sulfide/dihydroorotate dehydrogenase-like FAD/NAD-binding protein [Candidatus Omnitrophica bacterium]|nr:sulfide/dihydroorotate dehydrogenase-like FAD/NAD-binding protein [Candidatus Omnitrophota bacterium]
MKIIEKKVLADYQDTKITKLVILSPDIARKALPGQFVVVMAKEESERIPLTVVESQDEKITLILQELGFSTKLLGSFNVKDSLYALAGPLGHPTEIKNYGHIILVGGGVGIAEIFPVAKALKKAGNNVISIIGARTKDLLILENELKENSDKLYICTDDGSYGTKAFTTDLLKQLLNDTRHPMPYTLVYAVGPIPMMKKVTEVTKEFSVKTMVSLNALMVDGTGMCGCCRATVGGEVKFSCIDGPEFDAHLVDWEELEKRNRIYIDKEKHICNLNKL